MAEVLGTDLSTLSFAELGLRARIALMRTMTPAAARWIAEAPLTLPGRPPRLPAADMSHTLPWEGRGPREWRVYTRRQVDPRMPFLLRAVVPDARPYEQVVDAAFQTFLNRLPDPGSRADYARSIERGALSVEVVLRAIAASAEAQAREEEVRLVCAAIP
ncbi:hypothetical protein HMPREF9946_03052 [Acetobacteraceae bacterium AT-5844]|nr:hypothetical protein HMPREF9946_03052 [Acetobacteraceae bacterium AT-5844]